MSDKNFEQLYKKALAAATQGDYEYNMRERQRAHKKVAEVRALPLDERKENQTNFADAMANRPEIVGERIGWLLDGTHGYGEMIQAREVLTRPRMNQEAQLTQLVGLYEWNCPADLTISAWKKLTPVQKSKLSAAVARAIRDHKKEMVENEAPVEDVSKLSKKGLLEAAKHGRALAGEHDTTEKAARKAMYGSSPKHGVYDGTEIGYRDQIFAHIGKDSVRNAYIEPVLARLLKRAAKERIDYDVAFKAIKRGVVEAAQNWKLENVMTTGLSKAALARQQEAVARTIMENIYLARLGDARRAGKAV